VTNDTRDALLVGMALLFIIGLLVWTQELAECMKWLWRTLVG